MTPEQIAQVVAALDAAISLLGPAKAAVGHAEYHARDPHERQKASIAEQAIHRASFDLRYARNTIRGEYGAPRGRRSPAPTSRREVQP